MKHIIGHIGDDFMGQMTQPIVSSIKALKDNDIATVNVCVCVCMWIGVVNTILPLLIWTRHEIS